MNEPKNASLTCDGFAERLADFLERDVPEPVRAAMEAHALACDDCGPLLADLRRLRIDAANLPDLAPSRDLWAGISARIETPVVELPSRPERGRAGGPRRVANGLWLGLAAAGLVAVTATITREVTRRSIAPGATTGTVVAATTPPRPDSTRGATPASPSAPTTTVAAAPSASGTAAAAGAAAVRSSGSGTTGSTPARLASNGKPSAEETYDREIAKLRAVLNYRRRDLDTATVAVVDRNLKIIDDAIAQCRVALKKDPASRFLLESLNDALDSKVQLLRTAATLPPRT